MAHNIYLSIRLSSSLFVFFFSLSWNKVFEISFIQKRNSVKNRELHIIFLLNKAIQWNTLVGQKIIFNWISPKKFNKSICFHSKDSSSNIHQQRNIANAYIRLPTSPLPISSCFPSLTALSARCDYTCIFSLEHNYYTQAHFPLNIWDTNVYFSMTTITTHMYIFIRSLSCFASHSVTILYRPSWRFVTWIR